MDKYLENVFKQIDKIQDNLIRIKYFNNEIYDIVDDTCRTYHNEEDKEEYFNNVVYLLNKKKR